MPCLCSPKRSPSTDEDFAHQSAPASRTLCQSSGGEKRDAFLIGHGSFSPPHRGHRELYVLARKRLEEEGYNVVRGILGLSIPKLMWAKQLCHIAIQRDWCEDWLICDDRGRDYSSAQDMLNGLLTHEYPDATGFVVAWASKVTQDSIRDTVVVGPERQLPREDSKSRVFVVNCDPSVADIDSRLVRRAAGAENLEQLNAWLGEHTLRLMSSRPPLPDDGYDALIHNASHVYSLSDYAHDAGAWLKSFRDAGDGTSDPNMKAIRALRALIWRQTEKALKDERLIHLNYLNLTSTPLTEVVRLPEPPSVAMVAPEQEGGRCRFRIVERDLLEEAGDLVQQGLSVAVLNMANASSPGGGFVQGAGAQEENLHRRSDAVRFTKQRKGNYPIPKDACLLSHGVTVFRGSERNGYPFLDVCFKVDMISCAAVSHPKLTSFCDYASAQTRAEMEKKVALIITAAAQAGCNAAVLSAFGCGAFGNPPWAVAEMFRKELDRAPLDQAVFCIFDDHNAGRFHNPRGNLQPFKEAFGILQDEALRDSTA